LTSSRALTTNIDHFRPSSKNAQRSNFLFWSPISTIDPFGEREAEVHTPTTGIVIGRINLLLVNEGEALFHIARVGPAEETGAEAVTTLMPDLEEVRATETAAEPPLGQ